MSAYDDYLLAVIGALGADALETDEDGEPRAFAIAQRLKRGACEWDGHDIEAVVDLHLREEWWRCRRCGFVVDEKEVYENGSAEGLETLKSHALRRP